MSDGGAAAPVDASGAAQTLRQAAELIREDPIRRGCTLHFGNAGQLVMTGDLHGNLRNFEKLRKFCALERSPARYVVLHELIHCDLSSPADLDLSIDLLIRAAAWKCAFPDNVFFLQSNHELAQLTGQEITKGGRSVLRDFERGVAYRFGPQAGDVLDAVREYIAALPLAARTGNGVFCSHSLPDEFAAQSFDPAMLTREPTPGELAPGGPAYAMVWGRFQRPEFLERFAERVGARIFVVGHTPQETGFNVVGRMIILASDHNHGTFLTIDLSKLLDVEELLWSMRKFVSIE